MKRETERNPRYGAIVAPGGNVCAAIDKLCDFEDLMDRWKLRGIAELERTLLRVKQAGGVAALPEAPDEAIWLARIRQEAQTAPGQTCEECVHYKQDYPKRSGVCEARPRRDRHGTIVGPTLHVWARRRKCLDFDQILK